MIKLTRSQIMKNFLIVLRIGNHDKVKNLFDNLLPSGVWFGRYGWNANIYVVGAFDMAIVAGNNTFGNFELSREELKKWDDKAYEILSQKGTTVGEKNRAIYYLNYDFYKYVREEYFKKLKAERELNKQ